MTKHFDTLGAAEELEAAGLPAPAAKAISLVVDRSREDDKLASEMKTMRVDFGEEIAVLKTDIAKLKIDVAELKTDVAKLKTDVAKLETDVAVLKTDVARLKIDVAELKTDIAKLRADVAELKTDIAVLKSQMKAFFWVSGVIVAAVLANFAVTVNIMLSLT